MLENVTSSVLTSEERTLPNPVPTVTASWQVVEGIKVGEEEGELAGTDGVRANLYGDNSILQSCRTECSLLLRSLK